MKKSTVFMILTIAFVIISRLALIYVSEILGLIFAIACIISAITNFILLAKGK